ncbi:bifunctional diguanylate cyclase/phosphodiesterase [Aliiglaciecola sp. LCG003]|uniref:putative bifunctional diguanylate cyclase/phosphodiesterase n=1 Tax=Aliiglaciecola sp. LCG003 TaxID=3053655 RepID=UPI0025728DD3|nr:bifunctional diguanylate cyclase/phosphodiesterase [Aliiglaciecola sp. LCG003]WJG09519.1 EAL domain-containing protein [Aliiglaciecola sp. LCG003]
MTLLSLKKINNDFLVEQNDIKQQTQSQYNLLNEMLLSRLESWVELFGQLYQNEPDQIQALADSFAARFDFLQLNWQVEGIWLFDPKAALLYSTEPNLAPHILANTEQVYIEQRSNATTYCEQYCSKILSIPILDNTGQLNVVTLSVGLVDTLAFLNQSTKATLALVHLPEDTGSISANSLTIRGPLSKKNIEFVRTVINTMPDELSFESLAEYGTRVDLNGQSYFIVLIPIVTENAKLDYVLSAHNITDMIQTLRSYQRNILITASTVFIIALFVFYILTNSVRRRLVSLAARLPLLAQRDFDGFRQQVRISKHLFRDELDTLSDSAYELAERLEQLDKDVLAKTTELENIAMYDQLTHLPNRNMLLFQLKQAVLNLKREPGYAVVLIFDLDDFKKVNDSHGHTTGDHLLQEAAARFQSVVRETDIACRLGGDEFAILLQHIDDISGAIIVAEKLLERFRSPINVDNSRFYVSTSIGIAFTNSCDTDVAEIIRYADIAMYDAKSSGGNGYKLYNEAMSKLAIDKVALEDEARSALINDHFSFALQPQIELKTGKLVGFEALLRWNHPVRGAVSPGYFIPILENTEFMLSLGFWCIENAFKLLDEFRSRGYPDLKIAINLAAIQFLDPELIPYLQEKVRETGLSADLIELELTERTLVSDVQRTTEIMHQLVKLGFIISIDDFGTGYSSLSYLKNMPAHYIKIDRAFVDGMLSSNADKEIVASTVTMVQKLNMQVIAEGIEEQTQIDMLLDFDCDMAQGYFIARPIFQQDLFAELSEHYIDGNWHYGPAHHAGLNQS